MTEQPKVIRRLKTFVTITDKHGIVYDGLQLGLAEKCGGKPGYDGEMIYVTKAYEEWSPEKKAALSKQVFISHRAPVDYIIWEVTHGDNDQYVTTLYPGDLLLFIDGSFVPYIGEQVKLGFNVTKETRELPPEPNT